jgi:type IV pilus assembly protein PilM
MINLDIEDNSIRMMVVKGRRVELAASSDLEPGLVEDGVIVNAARVSKQITKLMTTHGVTDKKVVVSISGINSIYRVVRIPRLPKKMLAEAAVREMTRVMPVPLNQIYTSWQAINMSKTETVISMIGLPRNNVDTVMEVLHNAGLDSRLMDIKPLAIARVADEKDALIISVETGSFDIVVMIDGIPELLRSLSFPGKDTSTEDRISTIKKELEKTVNFYNSSHKESPMNDNIPVFVSGDQAEILTEQLDYAVKPLPALLSYREGFDTHSYAVNTGLAVKQVRVAESGIRININAISEKYLPRPRPVAAIVAVSFIVVGIIVIMQLFMMTFRASKETSVLQSQVANAQNQSQVFKETSSEMTKLQESLDEKEAVLTTFKGPLERYVAQREKVNGDLGTITSSLPGTVILNSIEYSEKFDRKRLLLRGTAPDEATILMYSNALQESGRFYQVIISSMTVVDYNVIRFHLNLTP